MQQIRLNATTLQNVVTYNVRVSLSNPEQILLPGMTAYVNIAVDHRQDALLVPNAALRFKPTDADAIDKEKTATGESERRTSGPGNGGGKSGRKKIETANGTVYVISNGALKAIGVQLGITDSRNTEVVGGDLKAGDRVITGEISGNASGKPSSIGMRLF